ncbi:saxiphilin-like isoform X1 [Erpetoichthys calabaricus]|uniref:saxiphilin-like isoform X1 n=1 Tax=Erpetoichthys calabaricus TaxID=27687 RepID=UPI00223463AF|nr:saxiphilin-like isoform X1 [Erpetoichthys calabaricus]
MRVPTFTVILMASLGVMSWGKKLRWCTVSDQEQRKCAELAKALVAVLPIEAINSFGRLSCIKAYSTTDCINKIRANKADAVSLDAGEVYSAIKQFDLIAVAKEMHKDGSCVFAVAIVRNQSLDIHSLQHTRSCHSGARWTAGWNLPMGFLLSRNMLRWHENQTLNEAISTFFSKSCIPGANGMAHSLCSLCQGHKSYIRDQNYFCETTDNEPFFDSEGAIRCLQGGWADVAFLDHTAILKMENSEKEHYRLLCPDGSKAQLDDYRKCNLGQGPGNAVVTRHNYRRLARKFLSVVQKQFGPKGKESSRFHLFNSSFFDGNNLMFRDSTDRLAILSDNTDINQILGLDYVSLLKGLGHEGSSMDNSVIRWCCISSAEQKKCEDWALNIKSDPLVCVRASSMRGCIEMIKRDEADAASLDGTHTYMAGQCGLVPVAVEYYGDDCIPSIDEEWQKMHHSGEVLPPVYAVAVVKTSSRNMHIGTLARRRSCHGQIYSPAGWLLPVNHTVRANPNKTYECDINAAYRTFFWKGCMPGAKANLCKVCVGGTEDEGPKSSHQRCAANHNEFFYGNMGSLRCLVGDSSGKSFGDVAFMEHHNLLENIKSLEFSGWSRGWILSDFELLCPDGRRASLSEWKNCHLGPVPPNIVMTRPVITTKIYDFLLKSQETLEAHPESDFQLFQSHNYGESDLLFKDQTECLVHTGHLSYRSLIGEDFFQLVEAAFKCTESDILPFCKQDVCNIF